ncbi:hypothetical protein [Hyphomonas sp.]|jgi:hypothetical protein|uniref:hypothetical protein n=1 Tax=Hyphomonas sp. TaxID=87 RepID=UPI0025B97E92|nr:hypothetical protein [Hyphomonas sp.]
MIRIVCAAAAVLTLCACETTSSRPYTPSTSNIMAFQSALKEDGVQVQLSSFTAGPEVNEAMTCRALGALEVAPGKTPIEFVEGAMRDELFAAGVYDQTDGNVIRGEVTELNFNSFGTGSWKIGLKLSSDTLPEGYSVNTQYKFKTSYSALKACQNVIDAFTPAVQELIGSAVADPKFKELAGSGDEATS